mmetsp:Transcript_117223/g.373399  ORF Transcript_117223/g.373399 Transcript_117223/m.373399 type:complete len:276 (-) Transcript_117223:562-1389(-)
MRDKSAKCPKHELSFASLHPHHSDRCVRVLSGAGVSVPRSQNTSSGASQRVLWSRLGRCPRCIRCCPCARLSCRQRSSTPRSRAGTCDTTCVTSRRSTRRRSASRASAPGAAASPAPAATSRELARRCFLPACDAASPWPGMRGSIPRRPPCRGCRCSSTPRRCAISCLPRAWPRRGMARWRPGRALGPTLLRTTPRRLAWTCLQIVMTTTGGTHGSAPSPTPPRDLRPRRRLRLRWHCRPRRRCSIASWIAPRSTTFLLCSSCSMPPSSAFKPT